MFWDEASGLSVSMIINTPIQISMTFTLRCWCKEGRNGDELEAGLCVEDGGGRCVSISARRTARDFPRAETNISGLNPVDLRRVENDVKIILVLEIWVVVVFISSLVHFC